MSISPTPSPLRLSPNQMIEERSDSNPVPRWRGAKLIPLVISVAIGLIVRFAIPKPAHVSKQAWQLLAIFLTTIAGLVLSPLPIGAWALVCITITVITKTLPFSAAFAAFTNEVIWLIVASFFFSRGFVKTGLGDRIAMYFVKWLGKSTLGLSYGLVLSEALIAPAMPSSTARAGGIFLPIINSLSLSADSRPKDVSSKKLGAYLVQSQLQSAGNSSALYLTGAAQNLLCINLAEELGVKIANPWVSWFKVACLPALISLLATPVILYKIFPPETKKTPDASAMAARKLEQMGPITRNEWVMLGTMLVTVALWISGSLVIAIVVIFVAFMMVMEDVMVKSAVAIVLSGNVPISVIVNIMWIIFGISEGGHPIKALDIASVVAALLGLSILLLLGVLDWDDCLSEKSAWDTLAWFAVLVGMAGQLTALGVTSWISSHLANSLKSLSLGWPAAFCILQAVYFFIHYLFASQTAHVGALYSAFLSMHLASKVPGLLAALALAYNTNLFGALTHYSSGQAAVYYGGGYVELPDVFKVGILMALVNLVIWGLVGTLWWKILGLF